MISSTLGAPLGGTTRGGHQGVDSEALSLITPPNFASGGGSWLPGIVIVEVGEPGVPVTCCAPTAVVANASNREAKTDFRSPSLGAICPTLLFAQEFINLNRYQGLASYFERATVLHQLLEEFAMNSLISSLQDESGATWIAMIASGVAVAIVGAVNNLGSTIKTMWSSVYTALK
jgi:Flp pilus assembly pilin Flp